MSIPSRTNGRAVVIALVAGLILGLASLLAVRLLPHPAALLGTLGGPWLATAFAVGAAAKTRTTGAWAGAVSMAAALATYYVARKVMGPAAYGGVTVHGEAVPYLVIGLLAGAGMGVLGAFWTSGGTRWRAVAAGLLAAALLAEVIVLTSRSWSGPELVFAALQGGGAIAAAWILPRSIRGRFLALVIAGGSAPVVAGAILELDLPLRLFP